MVAQVYSLHDFVPANQQQKLQVLKEIRELLKPSIFAKLSAKDRKRVEEILPPRGIGPIGIRDLPPLVLDRFRLANGKIGDLVIVEPVVDKVALANGDNQYRLIHELRTAADSVKPGTPVVGTLPITVDMYQS